MPTNDEFLRFMAAWALVHESADEGWKAAVARGEAGTGDAMHRGPDAFVDGLSAMIAAEKERLKADLAAGAASSDTSAGAVADKLDELRFEVGELRGRIESLQASLDALLDRGSDDPVR